MLYRHRGHAYLNLGRPEEAAADFVRGIASDPYNWDCWYHLGLAYYLMGWFVQAEETYKRCLELSRDDESIICTSDWYSVPGIPAWVSWQKKISCVLLQTHRRFFECKICWNFPENCGQRHREPA